MNIFRFCAPNQIALLPVQYSLHVGAGTVPNDPAIALLTEDFRVVPVV